MNAPEREPEIELRPSEVAPDSAEFALSRAETRRGVPVVLMKAPVCRPAGQPPRRKRKPQVAPKFVGLCPLTRSIADQSPGGDAMLVWYRSHGTERKREVWTWLVRHAIVCQWDCSPVQTAVIALWAMERVTAGRRRIRPIPPPRMGETKFEQMLAVASAWLRMRVVEAEYRYRKALRSSAGQIPAERYNRSRKSHCVHYPTRPNCYLRKANPVAQELAIELDKAA